MKANGSGRITKFGRSNYILLDTDLRDKYGLKEGDLVEYQLIAIAPGGQISQTRMMPSVADSVGTGYAKDGPDGNWYSFSRSCLYGLLNAPFDSVFFPKNNKYSGGFALQAV